MESSEGLPAALKEKKPIYKAAVNFLRALDAVLISSPGHKFLLQHVGTDKRVCGQWMSLKASLKSSPFPKTTKTFLESLSKFYVLSGKAPNEIVALSQQYKNSLGVGSAAQSPPTTLQTYTPQPQPQPQPQPPISSTSTLSPQLPISNSSTYISSPQIPPSSSTSGSSRFVYPQTPNTHPTPPSQPPRILLIDSGSACLAAVDLLNASDPIGVDCEFVQPSNALALVQVCSSSGQVYIFDTLCSERQYIQSFLYDLLSTPRTKIMHDCRQDCAILAQALGAPISGVFDTQVTEALLCSISEHKALLTDLDSIERGQRKGLNQLLTKFNLPNNPHKEAVNHELWGQRPLSQLMLNYAAEDVTQLIPLHLALKDALAAATLALGEDLSSVQSQWFIEGSDKADTYANKAKLHHSKDYYLAFVEQEGHKKKAKYLEELTEEVLTIPAPPPRDEDEVLESLLYFTMPNKGSEIRSFIEKRLPKKSPVEIVVDHFRPLSVRFSDSSEEHFADSTDNIYPYIKSLQTLHTSKKREKEEAELPSTERGGRVFSSDNRTGIPKTLHRISCIRNRQEEIIGLTYRIGKHVPGAARMIDDLIEGILPTMSEAGVFRGGLLLVGPPGKGKTTLLREITNVLSTTYRQQVVIVDTSDEIAGPSDVPDPCVGNARRMSVPKRNEQEKIMIEAVQNQTPTVIVVDEIGNPREVHAVRTISQRGVSVVGTAHGTTIHTLLSNPDLIDLVGGVEAQTLGDTEAKLHAKAQGKKGTDKTKFKRKHEPPFSTLIEIVDRNKFRIYRSLRSAVDSLLENNIKQPYYAEERWLDSERRCHSKFVRVKKPSDLDSELDYVIV